VSDVVTEYLELGLRLGRHVDGLVDSYYGPPEVAERVEREAVRDPSELARDAGRLLEELDEGELDGQRARWLRAQLLGAETVARRLAGEEMAFQDEVERCYGIRPEPILEAEFEAAHRAIDAALPGPGPVADRYRAWREDDAIPPDALAQVVDALSADLRERTEALFGLPEGEEVELEYVTNEPWAAYNYYLGGLRSRVAINLDRPHAPDFVAELVAHESYPGHHTEHTSKELLLVRSRGQLEESILLIGTPQSTVSEGIAGLGAEILLGEEEERVTAAHVAATRVKYDADVSRVVKQARKPLGGVQVNAALMLADGATQDEARDYLMHWGLASERRASALLEFVNHPVWRVYASTYTHGHDLCRDFVGGDAGRFKRLLTEQLTPADLR
jgi:hypothetical protein